MPDHNCEFPEIEIEEADADDNLKAGWKVLVPCPVCQTSPYDHIQFVENRCDELQNSLLAVEPFRQWYHWSPKARRTQILSYGLLPSRKSTSTEGLDYKAPYICLGDSPSWAWALSGGMKHTPKGEWDLWMTWQDKITDPKVMGDPERHTGIYELRTEHRIYKRDIWYVGSRLKV